MSITKKIVQVIDYHLIPIFGKLCLSKNKYCNVIYYHDIVTGEGFSYMRTEKDVFIQQMNYLADNGYETLIFDDLDDALKLSFGKNKIIIAFDDGWRSNYTEIFDFMKSKNLKYNVFLTIGEIENNPEYLTWDMVREMHDSGLVGFGTHTFTHPSMADLSLINCQREVTEADDKFKKEIGYIPLDFCYPFGYYSEDSNLHLEKESSYKRIYTSQKMYSYEQNGKIIFGRNGISNDDSINIFRKKVKGNMNFLKVYEDHVLNPLVALFHKIRKKE